LFYSKVNKQSYSRNFSAKVLRYTQGMTLEDFLADDRTFDAVMRNLQING
jgi:uncharacterized protein with HEPN domain